MGWIRNWKKDWNDSWKSSWMPGNDVVPRFGLTSWYDASDPAYLTLASTAITQFLDRSGNGNPTLVQSTGTARPTLTAAALNGRSVASFDGGDTLVLPSAIYSIANGNNTIFSVAKRNAGVATEIIISGSEAASSRCSLRFGNGTIDFISNTTAGTGVVSFATTTTNYNVITAFRSGTTQSITANGGTPTTDANGASESGVDAWAIGSLAGSANFLTGSIAEILIYNRALTAAEIVQVELYLANKWGIYHPNATWITAYSPFWQMLIHAWKINKDDVGTNTTGNPFAAIYDPSVTALGSTTSLTDVGRGVNTATEATNPPINTAGAIGAANGLLYDGVNTTLNAGSDSSIDDIFAAGGCFIGVIKPTTVGENAVGRIFDKGSITQSANYLNSGSTANFYFEEAFSVTNGSWRTTNKDITLGAVNITAITYSSANVSNNPTLYVNSLTPKAVTQLTIPTLTVTSDAATALILGNNIAKTRTFDGYLGKMLFLKSVPTTAQLTAVFNFLATEYGITLS